MRCYYSLGLIILFFILTGCAKSNICMHGPRSTQEVWMYEMETNPDCWADDADPWFRMNNPELKTIPNIPRGKVITRKLDVPYFSKLVINGDFHVQIVGDSTQSITIDGPLKAVNAIAATAINHSLHIYDKYAELNIKGSKKIKKPPVNMALVMLRIGVKDLKALTHGGKGQLEGIKLNSPKLNIVSTGKGNIYLSGNMNVRRIINIGQGSVNLFGVNSPLLDIETRGTGDTNVCGNVGINIIIHHGNNNITILGANSNCLTINADGCGKVVVSGIVNLYEVKALGQTKVYVDRIHSQCLNVVARKYACVGLKGSACVANFYATDVATINTRYVCADSGYIRALGNAHINISANGEIFTSSSGHSSVYFFGSPSLLTSFLGGNGSIIPVIVEPNCCPVKKVILPVAVVQKPVKKPKCLTKKILAGEG